jgi:hypothetical protein
MFRPSNNLDYYYPPAYRLGLLSGFFLSGFPLPILAAFIADLILLELTILNTGVQVMKLFIMQLSPFTRHFIFPWPEYSPQHPFLEHSQTIFFP